MFKVLLIIISMFAMWGLMVITGTAGQIQQSKKQQWIYLPEAECIVVNVLPSDHIKSIENRSRLAVKSVEEWRSRKKE